MGERDDEWGTLMDQIHAWFGRVDRMSLHLTP